MKTRYRIVKLRNGEYAAQWRTIFRKWEFFYNTILIHVIMTFHSDSEALYFIKHQNEKSTDIVEIVKEL